MPHKLPSEPVAATKPREPTPNVMIVTCKICGQRFNLFNLMEAYHHGPEPHEPLSSQR